MTKQYLLIAVASFLLLLSVACSSNSKEVSPIAPTPDIEATISARIKSIDIPATVEAMVEKRLLNAPTPFPKIIERVVEVEVIKEVPVPVTTVSITPTPQIIEKIVEIEIKNYQHGQTLLIVQMNHNFSLIYILFKVIA